jgi:hypothetical protein
VCVWWHNNCPLYAAELVILEAQEGRFFLLLTRYGLFSPVLNHVFEEQSQLSISKSALGTMILSFSFTLLLAVMLKEVLSLSFQV